MKAPSTFIHLRRNTNAQRYVYVWTGETKCNGPQARKVRSAMLLGKPYRFRDLVNEIYRYPGVPVGVIQSALVNLIKSGDVVKIPFVWKKP